jgi:hypothetical protein
MSLANVLIYAGLLVLVVFKRVQGKAVTSAKQLFVLPVILTVLGIEDFSHANPDAIDIAVGVAGCAISLGLGALRGTRNRLSVREGLPWVQWGTASVVIFAVNIVAKLALDVAGVAVGGSTAGVTSSLLVAAGLMLAGEAAVVWFRLQTGGGASVPKSLQRSGTTPFLPLSASDRRLGVHDDSPEL